MKQVQVNEILEYIGDSRVVSIPMETTKRATWSRQPETATHSNAWRLSVDGQYVALVVEHHTGLYSACTYTLGKSCKVGDVYGSVGAAKVACLRRLKKREVMQ